MSVARADSPSATSATDRRHHRLEPEQLWDRHGGSLYATARALLGEERAALQAVTLGMMDLYRDPQHEAGPRLDEALRSATVCVYRRCAQVPADDSTRWTMHGPPVMARIADLALLQRRTLTLCVFGGHNYREAAELLGVPDGAVLRLLISGLQELARMEPVDAHRGNENGTRATEESETALDVERAYALFEDASRILMVEHGLAENHAVEMLCRRASAAGSTVVEAAERVIAEAGPAARSTVDHRGLDEA
jgi:DNA-directed RNA polymerase specialized sigma24 family protein